MNERIEELAKQAGHRYVPSSNCGPLRVEYLTPEMKKFTELIVKETMQIVANNLPQNTYQDVAKAVIEHFKE